MLDRLDETIVAISSAPGAGPVGIVRMSGQAAFAIADAIAAGSDDRPFGEVPGSTRVFGHVHLEGGGLVPADFYLFRAPRSYTRQDMVEIHAPGSPAVLAIIRQLCEAHGALPAQPGEFTARAFLNGAMSLTEAEAVAGVIRAESDTQLRASRRMMDGEVSQAVGSVRDELAELLALVEADIDFAEEPIDFITPPDLEQRLARIDHLLNEWLAGSVTVERFDALPRILLFGPPNAGKSSLMNRLSGTSRAICAAVAGTTRDILTAPVALGRVEAMLLDTAGIDRSEDEIIAQAREMTVSAAERVDTICVVVDLSVREDDHVRDMLATLELPRVVIAANKCDLVDEHETAFHVDNLQSWKLGPVCTVSATADTGIAQLRAALKDALADQTTTTVGESMMISERQHRAVGAARDAIDRAIALAASAGETIDCADLLAFELREALDQLGAVTGDVTTEDLLGQVFANFCIGK